ncbi:1-phosphatidylinositol 4,5-bisphosphate phosphodiesterase eta-2-like [Varroa jacobsoni]|uniref:Phosphoinositide phospholipase C n=1 Tax=Varroa destructor TaxID=109461 RepID=A0A7M7J755_VARDE|nr:1-phosphatidylinositol 4,5-bisphosphate phosphodiesterase eta-2-like [Varroa destructor]XP_022695410.1 1-phosphatidylinositol 4,5-bisphosphate phosphodiesterase eta-2-like [Varroa jacobsoni]
MGLALVRPYLAKDRSKLKRLSPDREWRWALLHLEAAYRSDQKRCNDFDQWLKAHFEQADLNNDGCVSYHECIELFRQMSCDLPKKGLRHHFNDVSGYPVELWNRGERVLDKKRFVALFNSIQLRPELHSLFDKYKITGSDFIGPKELQLFLRCDQLEEHSLEECQALIMLFTQDSYKGWGYGDKLTMRGFEAFLLSDLQDIFDYEHLSICQDMSRPLNEYFIASSHNTYLLQHQLIGPSSVTAYINALNKGCRCLELDVWNGPNCDPIIYHGRTLTSKILLKDVLQTIKVHAFVTNQCPIILSIENHCNAENEANMTKHLFNIFGERLCTDLVDDDTTRLPSPEQLKGKILIKAKRRNEQPSESIHHNNSGPNLTHTSSTKTLKVYRDVIQIAKSTRKKLNEDDENASFARTTLKGYRRGSSASTVSSPIVRSSVSPVASPKTIVARQLSDVLNYCVATKLKSFSDAENWRFNQMASFSETHCEEMLADAKTTQALANFARTHLTRVYPKPTRVHSTNFDPTPLFNVGCQMVALNYQTSDKNQFYNLSMFAQNGNCGYVLKPRILRDGFIFAQPDPDLRRLLTLTIISGQYMPARGEVTDPYVEIKIIGHPLDENCGRTSFVSNNGFNPIWNQTFQFLVNVPDLAQLVFVVMSDSRVGKNGRLGEYAIPLTAMREGYRHVHLRNLLFRNIVPSTLFVHVSLQRA